ncbi:MAG: phosphoglycerate kinase [Candidatus Mycalebacterium zealandia]|nr:MAG: phosphoglycerate kinase [Candidatus Mycalebacterium zealandia]
MVVSDLSDSEIRGKRFFVRVDFNVPIKGGKISEDYRIRRSLPTIDYLIERGAKVILASHLGRPAGRFSQSLSLVPVAELLGELLGKPVKFPGKVVNGEVEKQVASLEEGEVLFLENLRFHPEEKQCDQEFCRKLSGLADIYVNDAFGTSHRRHASTYGVAEYFEKKLAGFVVDKEVDFFNTLIENPERPYLVIVGGAKIKDKIRALENLLEKADQIIIGGGVAYTFLKAQGISIGQSIVEDEMVDWARSAIKDFGNKIALPCDHVAVEDTEISKNPVLIEGDIPDHLKGFDIGPKAIVQFISHIKGKKTIFWNGPMGVFEFDGFSNGTTQVARAMALATWRGATTVAGGGESIAAIRKAEVLGSELSHVSTGGGASLTFLGGDSLPGISILDEK